MGLGLQRSDLRRDLESLKQGTHMQDVVKGGRPASRVPWRALPLAAQVYVTFVVALGAVWLGLSVPTTFADPVMFVSLAVFACITSVWKVNLPIAVANGSTLSVSYAANLTSLLLLGPQHAALIAVAGAITQCRYKAKAEYPLYRTIFSAAAAGITMLATGAVYMILGGTTPPPAALAVAKPLVGAIGTYFLVNTSLIAGAIALSSNRTFAETWRRDFLWSAASFMVAGTAGALTAMVVQRGEHWIAVVLVAPIYLTYRSYELFAGRLEDQKRHTEEMRRLHNETMAALEQARSAEHALAEEKERLGLALADMTRLEESRNQLLAREQAARTAAEQASSLKDQFLAIVSHELRTPLNAVLGWADMLSRRALEGQLRERAVRGISEAARRQARLIEDLLDVARIASGKMRLDRTMVDLADVISDALLIAQPSAAIKHIRLSFDGGAWTPKIFGDRVRLEQVASNLISNAVKFTPDDGVVDVRMRRVGDRAEVVFSDSGQGIPAEFLPCVFELFRQADGSTTRMHAGLGLGLSIVKSLVEAHNGTVHVHSAGEGLGSTFVVTLPVAVWERSTTAASVSDTQPARGLPSLAGVRVLVIDDDEESREVVAAYLHGCHAVVSTVPSAAEGFALLQRERFDVLLADIGMPGEDGYSLIQRIRALCPPGSASIPAAALTAFARDEDRERALRAGFQLHLAKPIDASALVAAVAALNTMASA
jgi:signal transduction histidine kinase/CheY-like chemotaxis protein